VHTISRQKWTVIYAVWLLHVVYGNSIYLSVQWKKSHLEVILLCHLDVRWKGNKGETRQALTSAAELRSIVFTWLYSFQILSLHDCEYYKYFLEILPVTSIFPLWFANTDLPITDSMDGWLVPNSDVLYQPASSASRRKHFLI